MSEPASSWTSTMPAASCAAKRSTESNHAIFGFRPAAQRTLVRCRIHPVQRFQAQHAEDLGATGGAPKSDRADLVGQRGISGRDQSADWPVVALSSVGPAAVLRGR